MINGKQLRDAIISGANLLTNNRQQVDELNVFPVPDGDTGTNMSMTIGAAARELAMQSDASGVAAVAECAASALLRGARGNSGVILSLLFRGIAKGLAGLKTATARQMAAALEKGVEAAYKAVMKPTEGTMLTVARLAGEAAVRFAQQGGAFAPFWEEVCRAAGEALQQTPEMLPVLKKAGVVDAGGKGLTLVFEGMRSVFSEGKIIESGEPPVSGKPVDTASLSAAGEYEGEITFTYCTEYIVNKENGRDSLKLRAYLESIGDCVVVVDDDEIIKVHVHTDTPDKALGEGLKFGQLSNMKIENMRHQHATKAAENRAAKESREPYVPVDNTVEYGFVAVAAGEGVQSLFTDLGANQIVSGGQTMNPSTEDILRAVHAVPAKTVFVLPNNKNIIMAAEQVIPLADRRVCVLPTRTIPQGISALLAFDAERDVEANQLAMVKAADHVATGMLTFAARDSDYEGHKIKQGEILALENNHLSFTEKDLTKACVKLVRSLVGRDSQFVTLLYGEEITETEAEQVRETLRQKLSEDIEITLINGGQPVYYYILSVE